MTSKSWPSPDARYASPSTALRVALTRGGRATTRGELCTTRGGLVRDDVEVIPAGARSKGRKAPIQIEAGAVVEA